MQVVLIGATGRGGSRILNELLSRGHHVTAIARNVEKLPAGVKGVADDLSSAERLAEVFAGADAVVSAYMPPPDDVDQLAAVTEREIAAVRAAGSARLLVMGGAATLEVAPGVSLLASGHLPAEWVPIATAHSKAYDLLRSSDINWTYFSPAGLIEPGERTGKFRLGTHELVTDSSGQSRISFEDYAVALVDELENPAHQRARFTIGY